MTVPNRDGAKVRFPPPLVSGGVNAPFHARVLHIEGSRNSLPVHKKLINAAAGKLCEPVCTTHVETIDRGSFVAQNP